MFNAGTKSCLGIFPGVNLLGVVADLLLASELVWASEGRGEGSSEPEAASRAGVVFKQS